MSQKAKLNTPSTILTQKNLVPFCFWANFVVSVHCRARTKRIINFKLGKLSILDLKCTLFGTKKGKPIQLL